jgi:hypothetical protein
MPNFNAALTDAAGKPLRDDIAVAVNGGKEMPPTLGAASRAWRRRVRAGAIIFVTTPARRRECRAGPRDLRTERQDGRRTPIAPGFQRLGRKWSCDRICDCGDQRWIRWIRMCSLTSKCGNYRCFRTRRRGRVAEGGGLLNRYTL